ncbi:MAG: DUF547 domain-containing protein [Actinomycetota bacterium]
MFRGTAVLLAVVASLLCGTIEVSASDGTRNAGRRSAAELSHTDFGRVLERYVSPDGWVDYEGLARNRRELNEYLQQLASAQPATFPTDHDRLAFWINAYNAYTLDAVLDHVCGKVNGVREAPGFFDRERHAVAGQLLTLDQIEEHARSFHDPRVHFALVCASTSCPKLQRFAYAGQDLDAQLQLAMRDFLSNPVKGLKADPQHNRIYLSPIFKWYAGDFTGESSGAGQFFARARAYVSGNNLLRYVKQHAPETIARYMTEKDPEVEYFGYDWSLNGQRNHRSGEKSSTR